MTRTKNTEQDEKTVMLTLSNSMDQTRKIRVEVPEGTTVRQAARDAGIFPDGAFDVYTAEGDTVTNERAEGHRDATLYVGVQKVAGGNEQEMQLDPVDAPRKTIMFVSAFDPEVRNAVIPTDDQTARQAAEMAGLAPRDGSEWQVYDWEGEVVADRQANDLAGQTLYIGVVAVAAGSIPVPDMSRARADFPSIKTISGFRRGDSVDMFFIRLGDSRGRTVEGQYDCVIDYRNSIPNAHVLNLRSGIRHPHVYSRSRVPGTDRESYLVCQGEVNAVMSRASDESERLSAYLNHLASVLNS